MTNELVETARRIAPALGESAVEDNALRRLSDRSWNILMDNGFLRALQPARWAAAKYRWWNLSTLRSSSRAFRLPLHGSPA